MPSVTLTNLDNLPTGWSFTTGAVRTGNVLTWDNLRADFDLNYTTGTDDVKFAVGDKVQIALTVDSWTLRYLQCYARGKTINNPDATEYWNWSIIAGMSPESNVGMDANNGVRTGTAATVILELVCVRECIGFVFHFQSANSDGSGGNGTGQVTFRYCTSQFEPVDPYDGAGDSGPSGPGDGDFDFSSTDIPLPGLPSIGAMSTGFLNMYNPSAAQLRSLASYMWSGAFDPQNFKKLFADPMDAILGLHIIPTISGHPATTSSSLHVGNIDTGVSMPAVTEQYYTLDCGTVNIPAKWGAYLDYSPYSKLALYLPYIGVVPLSADDCMRGSIKVQYNIDMLSGTCSVAVYCVSNRGADGHTLYTFTGSCSCECPITEGQYANVIQAGLNVVSGIISGASGGVPGMVAGGVAKAANAAISMVKPEIGRSGSMGGSAGLMSIQYPFLILTVPRMVHPAKQNKYIGYPSFITLQMSECMGYTEINVTHLEGMTCTNGETEEIIRLLKEGVIF